MHLRLLEEEGGQSSEHGGSRGEPMRTHKAQAQRTIRAVLDEGITPHGQMEEVGDYHSLLCPLLTEAKEAAKQAARRYVQHHATPQLLELISAEVPAMPSEAPRRVGILLS